MAEQTQGGEVDKEQSGEEETRGRRVEDQGRQLKIGKTQCEGGGKAENYLYVFFMLQFHWGQNQ